MRRFGPALVYAVIADAVATIASYAAIVAWSSNTHDRGVEAAMTSVFVFGPIAAIVGFVVGAVRHRRR